MSETETPTKKLEQHELGKLLPAMDKADFEALKEDIKINGQIVAVCLYQGKVLDGWHRYLACEELGIEAKTKVWSGDPLTFVISANIARRHLTPSQRAEIIAEASKWLQTGRPTSKHGKITMFSSLAKAAELAGVSQSTMQAAKTVSDKGSAK